ncbi:MAG: aldo/keto reductase [Candidatus Hydrogenedentes bacterium]|nr:aldo/keto reductase [Candidatus Hydrogenedentota bacterium]
MRYRQLGQSELKLPVVSFGAWAIGGWMWGGSDDQAAIRAIHAAVDNGITCIDTAPAYGMGHSEQVVAKAIADRRDKVILATKCGLRWDLEEGQFYFDTIDNNSIPKKIYKNLRPTSVRAECEASLLRMKVDHIDLYQCHWPDETTPVADTMGTLLELQREGKIRVIGVSNYSVEMMQECLKHGRIESDQPRYSALDRHVESEILPFCQENNLGVLAYSPIEQGLLSGKVGPDRVFNEGDQRRNKPFFSQENRLRVLTMLKSLKPIAEAHNATFSQLFIAWVVAQPGLTTALVGARTEEQVVENSLAGTIELSESEEGEIRAAVESLRLKK